jgi:hypothetical protein
MGTKRPADLTPRLREWLDHLRRCAESGETVRAYAKRHGLSEHGMYQATKDLRKRGVPVPSSRGPKTKGVAFVKVAPVVRPPALPSAWRARLPNGVVLEGRGALETDFLEALARL